MLAFMKELFEKNKFHMIGYNINILQQTACLVVNPITITNFAFLLNCTLTGLTSDSMTVLTFKTYLWMKGLGLIAVSVVGAV